MYIAGNYILEQKTVAVGGMPDSVLECLPLQKEILCQISYLIITVPVFQVIEVTYFLWSLYLTDLCRNWNELYASCTREDKNCNAIIVVHLCTSLP